MPTTAQSDPIQEFVALPRDQQLSTLQSLSPEKQDKLLARVKEYRSKATVAPQGDIRPMTQRERFLTTYPVGEKGEGVGENLHSMAQNAGVGIFQVADAIVHPVRTAEGLIDSLNPASSAPNPVQQIYEGVSTRPGEVLSQMAGQTLAGEGIGEAVGPVARGLKEKVANARNVVVGRLTKTSPGETADLVKETKEANEADAAKVAKTNAEQEAKRKADLRQHFDKTQKVKEANVEAETGPERKTALTHGVEKLDTDFQGDLKQTAKDVKTRADEKYTTVRDALGPKKDATGEPIPNSAPTIPSSELAGAVKAAEGKIEGSSENLKVFRDILSKHPEDDPDFVKYQGADIPKGHALYDVLKEQGAMGSDKPATFADLQGYYTELGDKISSGNLPGDVYQAMKSLHESIGKIMQKMADDNKVGPQLRDAQQYYANYMRTFRDPNSPLYKAIKATERGKSIAALSGKDQTGIEALAKYNPELASRANTIRGYQAEAKLIPAKPKEAKPLPTLAEKPTPVTTEAKTIGTEDIHAAKEKGLQERSDFIKKRGGQIALTFGVYRMLENVIHGNLTALPADFAGAVVGYGTTQAIGKLLELPAVREFLTKPTASDLAQVPPAMRSDMSKIAQIAKAKGIKVDPKLAALLGVAATPKGPKTQKLQQARDHARFAHVATSPDGHRIGSNDGMQTWVDTETGESVHAQ